MASLVSNVWLSLISKGVMLLCLASPRGVILGVLFKNILPVLKSPSINIPSGESELASAILSINLLLNSSSLSTVRPGGRYKLHMTMDFPFTDTLAHTQSPPSSSKFLSLFTAKFVRVYIAVPPPSLFLLFK